MTNDQRRPVLGAVMKASQWGARVQNSWAFTILRDAHLSVGRLFDCRHGDSLKLLSDGRAGQNAHMSAGGSDLTGIPGKKEREPCSCWASRQADLIPGQLLGLQRQGVSGCSLCFPASVCLFSAQLLLLVPAIVPSISSTFELCLFSTFELYWLMVFLFPHLSSLKWP